MNRTTVFHDLRCCPETCHFAALYIGFWKYYHSKFYKLSFSFSFFFCFQLKKELSDALLAAEHERNNFKNEVRIADMAFRHRTGFLWHVELYFFFLCSALVTCFCLEFLLARCAICVSCDYFVLCFKHTRGLVLASSPLKSLPERTGCRDLSHEQFTRSVSRNKSQGLVPKIKLVWIRGTSRRDQSWSDFEAKMTSSHDGTSPRDLLRGLVAGASPLVYVDLYELHLNVTSY